MQYYQQLGVNDCGPTCLAMVANNNLTTLSAEIKALTSDKNASLARKAKATLEKLGIE